MHTDKFDRYIKLALFNVELYGIVLALEQVGQLCGVIHLIDTIQWRSWGCNDLGWQLYK